MAGIVFVKDDKFYIHSLNTKNDWTRGLTTVDQSNSMIQSQLISNITQNISLGDDFDLNGIEDEQIFAEAMNKLTDEVNSAVQQNFGSVMADMQNIVNSKNTLASFAATTTRFRSNAVAYEKLDKIFESIANVASLIYEVPPITLMWCLKDSPNFTGRLASTPMGRYIAARASEINGEMIQVTPAIQSAADQLAAALNAKTKGIGKGREAIQKAIYQMLQEFFHKELGEQAINAALSKVASQGLVEGLKAADDAIKHTGSLSIKSVDDSEIKHLAKSADIGLPSMRSDGSGYLDYALDGNSDGKGVQLSGYFGVSTKWYREIEGADGKIMIGHYKNEKGQGRGGTPVASQITLLNESPIVRYIDQLAHNYAAEAGYANAYARPEGEPYVDMVEKKATIAGFSGSGGKFYNDDNLINDTTLFFALNGKFYSVYKICANILKQADWRRHFSISYSGGKDAGIKANKWLGRRKPDRFKAGERSHNVVEALKRMKITIKLWPEKLLMYAR